MDDDIREKRVFGEHATGTEAFVASEAGLVRVGVADDRVGEFGLVHGGAVRDAAFAPDGGTLAVATPTDVLATGDDGALRGTEFGSATAVGFTGGGDLVAADDGGRVARAAGAEPGAWVETGALSEVRALDGDLVAAADGVYRLVGDDLAYAGLDDVRDVAVGAGAPLAAAGDGLYRLGNGWMVAREGAFRVVSAGADRAHAATEETLYERAGGVDDARWTACDLPVEGPVVGVGYAGTATYAVTADGVLLAAAGDGWRSRALGLPGVAALAVRAESARGKRV